MSSNSPNPSSPSVDSKNNSQGNKVDMKAEHWSKRKNENTTHHQDGSQPRVWCQSLK